MTDPPRTTVYVDVENVLRVPFLSGIQRTVRELTRRLARDRRLDLVPVVHCSECNAFRRLSEVEAARLYGDYDETGSMDRRRAVLSALRARTPDGIARRLRSVHGRLTHPGWHRGLALARFERGSVFLDIDAAWHNRQSRADLLPRLKRQSVTVVSLHYDIIPILFPDDVHPSIVEPFRAFIDAHIRHADLIVCISRNAESDLRGYALDRHGIECPRTDVITLGSDLSSITSDDDSLSPLPDSVDRYVLSVGTISPRKNYGLLIDAFDAIGGEFSDLHLVIVGRRGWKADDIVARIRGHRQFGRRLHWLEDVDDRRLAALYRGATMVVIPSRYEGFGLPVAEALQFGCRTLASRGGALPEAGGDNADYFDPDDVGGLVRKLETGLRSAKTPTMTRSSAAGSAVAGWDATAMQLADLLLLSAPVPAYR